jgi:hypothetical protein
MRLASFLSPESDADRASVPSLPKAAVRLDQHPIGVSPTSGASRATGENGPRSDARFNKRTLTTWRAPSSLEHLRHNLTAVTEGPLSAEVLAAIDDAALQAQAKWPPYFFGN